MDWSSDAATPLARGLTMNDRVALDAEIKGAARTLREGRWLNVRPDPLDFRDQGYEPGLRDLAACRMPDPLMARLKVRDQGYLSSCTGMALAFAVDLLRLRQWQAGGGSGKCPAPVSARMLFEMARAHDEFPDDGLPGSSLRGALRGFFHNGVCREVPDDDDPMRVPPNAWRFTVVKAKEARGVALGVYRRLKHVLLDYHAALNEIGVVLVSAQIHKGWLNDAPRRAGGRIVWKGADDSSGGHAFALVGYDQDGFLVRNSAGERWGGWPGPGGRLWSGVAHWSYADWERNVMDAWVIHLAVPLGRPFHATGGRFGPAGRPRSGGSRNATRILINGHYLNVKDGKLVRAGTFNSDRQSLEETAALLETNPDYDHLAVMVESGLDSFDTMVDRAAVLTPYLKAARIYPFFVFWQADVLATAAELLEDRARRLEPRTGGLAALAALFLENFARDFMQPIWRTFEGEVERSFGEGDAERGQVWDAMRRLLTGSGAGARPLKLHFVAHGTGALWLAGLLRRMGGDDSPGDAAVARQRAIGTINLLAPVIDRTGMQTALDDCWRRWKHEPGTDAAKPVAIYTLSVEDDAADRVGAFRGSFVELARRVFPVAGRVPHAGDDRNPVLGHASEARRLARRRDTVWHHVGNRAIRSSCRTHRELATDVVVLGHVLGRILGNAEAARSIAALPENALRDTDGNG
jgi:hypothetical protein